MKTQKIILLFVIISVLYNQTSSKQVLKELPSGKQYVLNPSTIRVANFQACYQACNEDKNCATMTYTTGNQCQVSSQKSPAPEDCPECQQNFEKVEIAFQIGPQNYDYLINPDSYITMDYLSCQKVCEEDSTCIAGVYDSSSYSCYISNQLKTSSPSSCSGCQSFIKYGVPVNQTYQQKYAGFQSSFDSVNFRYLGPYDYNVSDYVIDSTDIADCQQKCWEGSDCQLGYFMEDGPNKGKCYLSAKKEIKGTGIQFAVSFEKKYTPVLQNGFSEYGPYNFAKQRRSEILIRTNTDSCQRYCLTFSDCVGVVFTTGGHDTMFDCVIVTEWSDEPLPYEENYSPVYSFKKQSPTPFFTELTENMDTLINQSNVQYKGNSMYQHQCLDLCIQDQNCVGVLFSIRQTHISAGECWTAESVDSNSTIPFSRDCVSFVKN